jgi:hypothetical protein
MGSENAKPFPGANSRNSPCWLVIDRRGTLTYAAHPGFSTPTSSVKDVDLMPEALKKAAE